MSRADRFGTQVNVSLAEQEVIVLQSGLRRERSRTAQVKEARKKEDKLKL